MSSDVRERARVVLDELEVFTSDVPYWWIDVSEEGGVVQIALRRHDTIDSGFGQTLLNVLEISNVAIGENRN